VEANSRTSSIFTLYRVTLTDGVIHIEWVTSHHLYSHPAWSGESRDESIVDLHAGSTFYGTPAASCFSTPSSTTPMSRGGPTAAHR
jgi:hypothetical protein